MAVGIDAGAHGGDELLELPSLDNIEVGPERRELAGHAAGQLVAVTCTAILIRQDIFAILQGGPLWRSRDEAGKYRLALRK